MHWVPGHRLWLLNLSCISCWTFELQVFANTIFCCSVFVIRWPQARVAVCSSTWSSSSGCSKSCCQDHPAEVQFTSALWAPWGYWCKGWGQCLISSFEMPHCWVFGCNLMFIFSALGKCHIEGLIFSKFCKMLIIKVKIRKNEKQ